MSADRTLFGEYSREVRDAEQDYTIDGLVILDDDHAAALVYDAAESEYGILEGTRNADGIVFEPCRWHGASHREARWEHASEALEVIATMRDGYAFEVAAKLQK